MPIYEFECGECGEVFEDLVPAGTEVVACRACGREGARRRLSTFGVTRQPTPRQRRRMEDKRGTDRGGAKQRFEADLTRRRGGGGSSR